MRATTLALLLVAAGCGGPTTFKVGGFSLTVHDQGYYYTVGHDYCTGGGAGQMMLTFVDYNFLCDPTHGATPDPTMNVNSQLQIVLTIGLAPEFNANGGFYPTMMPYQASTADCDNYMGAPAVGRFLHYGTGTANPPDMKLIANSGSVTITQFDPAKKMPLKGSFDLHFGASEVKDTFSLDACN